MVKRRCIHTNKIAITTCGLSTFDLTHSFMYIFKEQYSLRICDTYRYGNYIDTLIEYHDTILCYMSIKNKCPSHESDL